MNKTQKVRENYLSKKELKELNSLKNHIEVKQPKKEQLTNLIGNSYWGVSHD